MLKKESLTTSRFRYEVQLLDGESGVIAFGTLANPLGRVLGALAQSASLDNPMIEAAMIFKELDVALLQKLVALFKPTTTVHGPDYKDGVQLSDVFALHFSGLYGEMVQWLMFCVKQNFESFFDDVKAGRLKF